MKQNSKVNICASFRITKIFSNYNFMKQRDSNIISMIKYYLYASKDTQIHTHVFQHDTREVLRVISSFYAPPQ